MTDRPSGEAGSVRFRRRSRLRRWTRRRRALFLDNLAESCSVDVAARAAGVDRNSAFDLKDEDPDFAKGWRRALDRAYCELALSLLAASKDGSIRTETVFDPKTREPKQVKQVHSYPLTIALRLFLVRRAEEETSRLAEDMAREVDTDARLGARMDEIRARLLAAPEGEDADDPDDMESGMREMGP